MFLLKMRFIEMPAEIEINEEEMSIFQMLRSYNKKEDDNNASH